VPDQLAGERAKCPSCGLIVRVVPVGVLVDPANRPTNKNPPPAESPVPQVEVPSVPIAEDVPKKSGLGLAALLLIAVSLSLPCCGAGGFALYWFGMRPPASDGEPVASAAKSAKRANGAGGEPAPENAGGDRSVETVRERLIKSSAWLITGDGRRGAVGSATIVHRDLRLLVSNYHVVNKFENIIVVFPAYDEGRLITQAQPYFDSSAEKGQPAQIVATDPVRDLVLIQVKQLPAGSRRLRLASDSCSAGQAVRVLGASDRPNGFGLEDDVLWRSVASTVSSLQNRKYAYKNGQNAEGLMIDLPDLSEPLDFGGAVVDDQCQLLGVSCPMTSADSNRARAIDVHEVRAVIEKYFQKIGKKWSDEDESGDAAPSFTIDEDNSLPSYWIHHVLKNTRGPQADRAHARLVQMGTAAILELRKALRDTDAHLRAAVASVLGDMRETAAAAVDDLAKALEDPDRSVRLAAAEALGKIGKPAKSALLPLLVAANDADPEMRRTAAEAIPEIGPPSRDDATKLVKLWSERSVEKRARLLAIMQAMKPDPATATVLFAPLLNDPDLNIRASVIESLAKAGPAAHADTFGKLLKAADDPNPKLRKTAMDALVKMGPAEQSDSKDLEAGLRANSEQVRLFCVEQLSRFGEKAQTSIPDIARLLRDADPPVRAAAATALGRIGSPALIVLDDLLACREDKSPIVRCAVVETLAIFGRERHLLPLLFSTFDDPEKRVRETAARALKSLKPPLGPADLSLLLPALKHSRIEARRFAAAELARLGSSAPDALPNLIEAIKDPDLEIRRHVFEALAAHGPAAKEAVPVILEAMTRSVEADPPPPGSADLFHHASMALTKIGEPMKALPICIKGLKSKDVGIQRFSIEWLGTAGAAGRKAAKDICALLADPQLAQPASELLLSLRGDEVVRALCDLIEDGTVMSARLAAVQVIAKMGPEAKDAFQTLYQTSNRYRGKELGTAARDALRQIQKK
jgi:HEAT repeat protein/S1-C subfamily serine protease